MEQVNVYLLIREDSAARFLASRSCNMPAVGNLLDRTAAVKGRFSSEITAYDSWNPCDIIVT
jgi:hypothetical protein